MLARSIDAFVSAHLSKAAHSRFVRTLAQVVCLLALLSLILLETRPDLPHTVRFFILLQTGDWSSVVEAIEQGDSSAISALRVLPEPEVRDALVRRFASRKTLPSPLMLLAISNCPPTDKTVALICEGYLSVSPSDGTTVGLTKTVGSGHDWGDYAGAEWPFWGKRSVFRVFGRYAILNLLRECVEGDIGLSPDSVRLLSMCVQKCLDDFGEPGEPGHQRRVREFSIEFDRKFGGNRSRGGTV